MVDLSQFHEFIARYLGEFAFIRCVKIHIQYIPVAFLIAGVYNVTLVPL